MSNDDETIYSFELPSGSRLDQSGRFPDGVLGNISMFPRATEPRIEALRKRVPEVPDERLDRSTDPWTDTESGETYELVRSYLNVIDPAASGAVAFVVSDGNLLGLRRAGWEQEGTSVVVGDFAPDGVRA